MNISVEHLNQVISSLHEFNPMMGHRGCRLDVTFPEIAKMQTAAIIKAALAVRSRRPAWKITPEIMVPLVGEEKELAFVKSIIDQTAKKIIKAAGSDMTYKVGTMIEIPRAALTADAIANQAEFFSFGTNDLTQMTFGFSRDDAGKFLASYYDNKIYESDPFSKLDQAGVGRLVKMASELGRQTRPDIKLGICGEQGGDPSTVEFCHNIGFDLRLVQPVPCSHRPPRCRAGCDQGKEEVSIFRRKICTPPTSLTGWGRFIRLKLCAHRSQYAKEKSHPNGWLFSLGRVTTMDQQTFQK